MGQNSSSWNKTVSFLKYNINPTCLELNSFYTKGNCNYNDIYKKFCSYCNNFSESLNLCGLSLGAVLALNYAIDFPSKVKSLILIAPQYDMPKFLLKAQNLVFKFMPESQFKNIGLTKYDFITLTNSMSDIDFTRNLEKVFCPVLVLCGEKDIVNKKTAIKLTNKLSNAKFYIISNAQHEVNIDNPKELANIINEFLI